MSDQPENVLGDTLFAQIETPKNKKTALKVPVEYADFKANLGRRLAAAPADLDNNRAKLEEALEKLRTQ